MEMAQTMAEQGLATACAALPWCELDAAIAGPQVIHANIKERCMKFLATIVALAGIMGATGCRHDYNPTPPYCCQPAPCGCAPTNCTPAYAPGTGANLLPNRSAVPPGSPYSGAPAGVYQPQPITSPPPGFAPGSSTFTPGANPSATVGPH
jgi:hypothetical protein